MEWLLNLDRELFYLINQSLANSVGDVIFPLITDRIATLVVFIPLLLWLVIRGGARGRIFVVLLILSIIVGDQFNSELLKEWVGRLRPCRDLPDVRLLVHCGGGKSFPSSHAVNMFVAAAMTSFFYSRARLYVFVYASLVAISRVYIGVHYPLDILAGACEGALIATLFYFLWRGVSSRWTVLALPVEASSVRSKK